MASDGKDYKTDITADPSQFEAGMKKAAKAAADASKSIDTEFKRIGDTFSSITKYVAGFTAVLAGGGALKKFISDANSWNSEAGKMSKQLGITTQQASVLNVALNHLGIESSVYTDAAMKMSKNIQSNAQAFEVLGVKTRDAAGAYRPVTELMGEVNQKLIAIKNPIEQNIAGQQVYGKGWAEVRSILKLTTGVMSEAEIRAKQLGLIVGPEGVAMSKQYSEQMRDLNLVGKSLEMQFGNALLPTFTRMGKFMSEEGPQMGQVFATVLEGIGFAAGAVWLALKDMGDSIGALAAQGAALLSGDLEGVKAIGKARDEESAKNEAAYERMKANFGKPIAPAIGKAESADQGPQYHFKQKAMDAEATGPAAPSRMGEWEAKLSETKAGLERQGMLEGQYRQMSAADELKYWAQLKMQKGLSDQERIALSRKTAELEMAGIKNDFEVKVATLQVEAAAYKNNTQERMRIELEIQSKYQAGTKQYEESAKRIVEIKRQAAEQERAIDEMKVQSGRDAQLQTIALEEQTIQTAAQLGLLSQEQILAAQMQFEDRRNAISRQGLYDRLTIAELDPDKNKVEIERIFSEIEKLEQAHQLRLGQIRSAAVVEQAKYSTQFFNSLQGDLQTSIKNVLTGTQTLSASFKSLFVSMGQTLAQVAAQMAATWLMTQLKMRLSSKQTALSETNNNAVAAAGGAYKAVVGIPIIGPILAPAAAAVAYGGVMAFGASASAAGGYDIPGTINPIVQTHAREMILPAKLSDTIRNMADQGQGLGSGGGDIHIHGSPNDSIQLKDLPAVLQKLNRNFHFVGARR
jgi:hypothetical protein